MENHSGFFSHINVVRRSVSIATILIPLEFPLSYEGFIFARAICHVLEAQSVFEIWKGDGHTRVNYAVTLPANFFFFFSGAPGHGPSSAMVSAMAERHRYLTEPECNGSAEPVLF